MIANGVTDTPSAPGDLYDRLVSAMAVAFGRAVRFARMRRDWDQGVLADRAGVNRGYLSAIERGTRNPTLDVVVRLARALDMSASALVAAAEQEEAAKAAQAPSPQVERRAR